MCTKVAVKHQASSFLIYGNHQVMAYNTRRWEVKCYDLVKSPHLVGSCAFILGKVTPSVENRPIQAKCVASVTNCGLRLEIAMASTVNKGLQHFTNGKYGKSNYTDTETSISTE